MLLVYGQIIIDECHHLPAVSFDKVLQKSPARYVVGLTATPYRKDGHQAIIHMQCGPARYEIKQVDGPTLSKRVIVRETAFKMPDDLGPQPAIHLVWEKLVADHARLDLVARDLRHAIEQGRFPLVISERKEHLALLSQAFDEHLRDIGAKGFVLIGGMGKKTRAATLEQIKAALNTKARPYKLARTLNLDLSHIEKKISLLDGICPEASDLLQDRQFSVDLSRVLRKMKPTRQVECVELMVAAGNVTVAYAEALLMATPKELLVDGAKPTNLRGISQEQMLRMEREMTTVQGQYKLVEQTYSDDVLNLVLARSYLVKLLENKAVVRHMRQRYPDYLEQFQGIVEITSLEGAGQLALAPT